jgi:hypothetical protein
LRNIFEITLRGLGGQVVDATLPRRQRFWLGVAGKKRVTSRKRAPLARCLSDCRRMPGKGVASGSPAGDGTSRLPCKRENTTISHPTPYPRSPLSVSSHLWSAPHGGGAGERCIADLDVERFLAVGVQERLQLRGVIDQARACVCRAGHRGQHAL